MKLCLVTAEHPAGDALPLPKREIGGVVSPLLQLLDLMKKGRWGHEWYKTYGMVDKAADGRHSMTNSTQKILLVERGDMIDMIETQTTEGPCEVQVGREGPPSSP